jgi:vacuolar-type H+-ATPase subunit I/STV1
MSNKYSEKRFYYFFCRGKRNKTCGADPKMLPMGVLEYEVERLIHERLKELRNTETGATPAQDPRINTLKIERHKIQEQIDGLIEQVVEGTAIAKHLDSAVKKLEVRMGELESEISQYEARQSRVNTVVDVDDVIRNWGGYSIERKNKIATIFVDRILVNGLDVEIIMA